jgi:hypothetical protein
MSGERERHRRKGGGQGSDAGREGSRVVGGEGEREKGGKGGRGEVTHKEQKGLCEL